MMNVEQVKPGHQWAEPLQGKYLDIKCLGSDLQITGFFPTYTAEDSPCDLIRQFEKTPKQMAMGQGTGTQSPEVAFANADTDEKLIAFVRKFGPVVAHDCSMPVDTGVSGPYFPLRLLAHQDMQELRNEQIIYRAALALEPVMKFMRVV